jgi:WS/DGAT/MGAT family acyltransferase
MTDAAYERLSAQDATFLDLESPTRHQHIAATTIFDAEPLRRPDGGIDIDRIRAYVAGRLHRLPRYRQRLARIPIEGHPAWVDDPHFHIAYHVRHTALPRPGDERQLKRLSGRVLSQPLDRGRPLWELWVVEGLEDGDRFAIVQKVHHCMIDGISGVDLMAVLMSAEPEPAFEPAPPWQPRPVPRGFDLVTTEMGRRLGTVFDVLDWAPRALREPGRLWERFREGAAAMGEALGAGLRSASNTPLNQPLGPHRRFDWLDMDLSEVKRVKDALGGTVNDVVLTTVAGALRRFLTLRRVPVDDLLIRANVPVSLRTRDERGTLGNRIALLMPELPVAEPDPLERLARVREAMARLKHSRQALGAEVLAAVSEWTSATLLSLAVRVATRGRPYNLVVTNVPGPQLPLYLLGCRMRTCYPVVNLLENQGLGVALFSYDGCLFWGFTADWERLPDLHEFVCAIRDSFDELRGLADRAAPRDAGHPPAARAAAGETG